MKTLSLVVLLLIIAVSCQPAERNITGTPAPDGIDGSRGAPGIMGGFEDATKECFRRFTSNDNPPRQKWEVIDCPK